MILVCLSTVPGRADGLRQVLTALARQTLRPNYIYLVYDGYPALPMLPSVSGCEVCAERTAEAQGTMYRLRQATGELFGFLDDAVLAVMDDDIVYPVDYLQRGVEHLNQYPDDLVTYHGKVWPPGAAEPSYLRFQDFVGAPSLTHAPGVGVSLMHLRTARLLRPVLAHPRFRHACDIGVGAALRLTGRAARVVPHRHEWLRDYREYPDSAWLTRRREQQRALRWARDKGLF